jgi:hypothetical protein
VIARIGTSEGVSTSQLFAVDNWPRVEASLGDKVLDLSETLLHGSAIALLAKVKEGLIFEAVLVCHGVVLLV